MKCGRCAGSFLLEVIDAAAGGGAAGASSTTTTAGAGAGGGGGGANGTPLNLHLVHPYVIVPSKEILENVHFDEWYCPFCLSEDSSRGIGLSASASARARASASASASASAEGKNNLGEALFSPSPSLPSTNSIFFSDEWGSSAVLPWLLHPGLGSLSDTIVERCVGA